MIICDEFCVIRDVCKMKGKDPAGRCLTLSKPLTKTKKSKLRQSMDTALLAQILRKLEKMDRVFPAP